MQRVWRRVCAVPGGAIRPVTTHLCRLNLSTNTTTTLNSQKPKRKARKATPTIVTPEEVKCDCVSPPDTVSNLRHLSFYIPPDETSLEHLYRQARADTQDWNQEFWARHNENFKKMKQEFIEANLKEKYGDSKGKKTLTADEMSRFYKSFLEDHRTAHRDYNREWYRRNVRNLILASRVWLQRKMNRNR